MSNADALRAMFTTFWDFLTQAPEFARLGVQAFNMLEGKVLPVAKDGTIATSDLPAFAIERVRNLSKDSERDDGARQRILKYGVDCIFVFRADEPGATAYDAMSAELVAEDVILSESARLGGLSGSPGVDDYELIPGETTEIPSVQNEQIVMFWVSRFSVVLSKQVTNPT